MTKANMELQNGTKITVEGTPEEVSKAIKLMQAETYSIRPNTPKGSPRKETKKRSYTGPSGAIKLLIDEGFLDSPKSAKEVETEMKRQGYHYSMGSISKLLLVNFMRNSKTLTRSKEDKTWKYVIRK